MKTMKQLREEIEARRGMTIDELANTVLIDDLTPEEFLLIQVMVNYNHTQVINEHTKILVELTSYPDEDDDERMFG